MTEEEFRERWNVEKAMYAAWGRYCRNRIIQELDAIRGAPSAGVFVKMPIEPRLKEIESMVVKAFRRKRYERPYEQTEDKVGIRIVVLVSDEISIVEDALERCTDIAAEKARDYEDERERNPSVFDYQSMHYILRPSSPLSSEGISIGLGTPCELQIRTLLQHAYSELTHDTIYKPRFAATSQARRIVAKSMALIEATDDYFVNVKQEVSSRESQSKALITDLETAYTSFIGVDPVSSLLNNLIADAYLESRFGQYKFDEISSWLGENKFVAERILERRETYEVFRIATILVVYFSVAMRPRDAARTFDLTPNEQRLIYSDLGKGAPG